MLGLVLVGCLRAVASKAELRAFVNTLGIRGR